MRAGKSKPVWPRSEREGEKESRGFSYAEEGKQGAPVPMSGRGKNFLKGVRPQGGKKKNLVLLRRGTTLTEGEKVSKGKTGKGARRGCQKKKREAMKKNKRRPG